MYENHAIFEAQIFIDKSKIYKVYGVGVMLLLVSIGCILWAQANWDAYTSIHYSVKRQRNVETGLAPILYGWGWMFTIAIPLIYGLMWWSFDFKNPVLGVNKNGLFINKDLFKNTFLHWGEFNRIERNANGDMLLFLLDPQKIVAQQPGFRKVFLKQTFVVQKAAICIENELRNKAIIACIQEYGHHA